MWFLLERFPLLLGAWDGLRYFIVALPEPSISLFTINMFLLVSQDFVVALYTEVCVQKHLLAMHILFASQQSGISEQPLPILFSTMTKPNHKTGYINKCVD